MLVGLIALTYGLDWQAALYGSVDGTWRMP
jgi:hypothetical protein